MDYGCFLRFLDSEVDDDGLGDEARWQGVNSIWRGRNSQLLGERERERERERSEEPALGSSILRDTKVWVRGCGAIIIININII